MLRGPFSYALAVGGLMLASCGQRQVPTSEENRQLDEADRLLNEAPANLDAIDDSGLTANNAAEQP